MFSSDTCVPAKNVACWHLHIIPADLLILYRKAVKNIKHAHQQASLLGHMQRLDMLDDPTSCYIEFGAGRGELSNYLKIAIDDHGAATFVLVDRTPSRNKFDNAILGLEQIKSLVKRHTMDIKDLVLADVPELRRDVTATQREPPLKKDIVEAADENEAPKEPEYVDKKPVVAMSKHLCGGATDLTLKCLANYQQRYVPSTLFWMFSFGSPKNVFVIPLSISLHSEREKSSLPSPVKGILIALCCHQLCHHYMYPNQEFLKEIDISPEEFVYLTRMSSWAVSVNNTIPEHASGSSSTLIDDKETTTDGFIADDDEHRVENDKALEELGYVINLLAKNYLRSDRIAQRSAKPTHSLVAAIRSHLPTLDFQARERLGQQCKRLLDVGRVRYLQKHGFDAELVYYVDRGTSLENLALMAVPAASPPQ
jgi:tRNA:m4X modification enzyme